MGGYICMYFNYSKQKHALELNHLSLAFPLSSQLKMLGSLDGCLKNKIIKLNSLSKYYRSLIYTWFFHWHSVHSSLRTSFLVVLAFFLRIGLDWPPNPCCLRSYLRFGQNSHLIEILVFLTHLLLP